MGFKFNGEEAIYNAAMEELTSIITPEKINSSIDEIRSIEHAPWGIMKAAANGEYFPDGEGYLAIFNHPTKSIIIDDVSIKEARLNLYNQFEALEEIVFDFALHFGKETFLAKGYGKIIKPFDNFKAKIREFDSKYYKNLNELKSSKPLLVIESKPWYKRIF